jgi:flagellar export protein FliJ
VKRFRFPLDRVRLWRAEQATLEELKLQGLLGQLAALADERARTANERAASEREVMGQDSIEARDLQALDAFQRHARTKIGRIEQRQRTLAGEIERQRARLIEARQRAELLERLKKKKHEEWQTLAAREEETLAGELYLAKRRR